MTTAKSFEVLSCNVSVNEVRCVRPTDKTVQLSTIIIYVLFLVAISKAAPIYAWTGLQGSKSLRHMKVVRLLALRTGRLSVGRVQLKCDGTRWRTEGEVKGKLANGVGSHTLHTTSEHGVSGITSADAHTSAASSRLNWRPRLFKLTRPFRRKTESGFCACAITFQTQSTYFGYRLIRPQCHIAAGMIMPMKYFNDSTGKRTQLPQTNATLRIPIASLVTGMGHCPGGKAGGALDTCLHRAPGFKKGYNFILLLPPSPCLNPYRTNVENRVSS
jgi:hypothetical protein